MPRSRSCQLAIRRRFVCAITPARVAHSSLDLVSFRQTRSCTATPHGRQRYPLLRLLGVGGDGQHLWRRSSGPTIDKRCSTTRTSTPASHRSSVPFMNSVSKRSMKPIRSSPIHTFGRPTMTMEGKACQRRPSLMQERCSSRFLGAKHLLTSLGSCHLHRCCRMPLSSRRSTAVTHTRRHRAPRPGAFTIEQREQMRRQRAQRVGHLSCKLLDKLALYTEGHYTTGGVHRVLCQGGVQPATRVIWSRAAQIRRVCLLDEGKAVPGEEQLLFLGLSSVYHSIKEKGHIVSQVYSTISAAHEMYSDVQRQQHEHGADHDGTNRVHQPPNAQQQQVTEVILRS